MPSTVELVSVFSHLAVVGPLVADREAATVQVHEHRKGSLGDAPTVNDDGDLTLRSGDGALPVGDIGAALVPVSATARGMFAQAVHS